MVFNIRLLPTTALALATCVCVIAIGACDHVNTILEQDSESSGSTRARRPRNRANDRNNDDDKTPSASSRRSRRRSNDSADNNSNTNRNINSQGAAQVVPPPPGQQRLTITFMEIGQGDGALLQTDDGHAAIIDAGPPEGFRHVREVLQSRSISTLDWLMLSHPHLDHIGASQRLLDLVSVQQVIDPGFNHPIVTYDRLLNRLRTQSIRYSSARTGQRLTLGRNVTVEILQPHLPFIDHSRSDANANSIVARISTGRVRVLFTGDAERETEERLLAENRAQLSADVLKVAHHGSRYASTSGFLDAVSPRYAVISCGQGNDYGHPHAETLSAIAQRSITFFRTDLQGDVTFSTDGNQVYFSSARTASASQLRRPGDGRADDSGR